MRLTRQIPGARKLLLCLYLGLSTFIAAHIVNSFIAETLLMPVALPAPIPSQNDAHKDPVSPQQLVQDIMARGLFALPDASPQDARASTSVGSGPPLDVAKKLLLNGTALRTGATPIAIIQDRSNQQQKLLHIHDLVPDVGELVAIEQTRVLFRDKGKEEWLELAMLIDLEQARRMPPIPELSQGRFHASAQSAHSKLLSLVSSVGNNQLLYILDRRALSQDLADISVLTLQAELVVPLTNGRPHGIRLDSVQFGSLYHKMGLQSGDVVKRFNGMELRESHMLLTFLAQMKDENKVKLDIVRNATPRTLTYEIR